MESVIDILVFIQNSPFVLFLITLIITLFLIFQIIKGENDESNKPK